MQPLIFRYPPAFVLLAVLGAPLLPIMAVLLPSVSIFLLVRTHLSLEMRLDAIFVLVLGIAFAWVTVMLFRTWYSVLTNYTVDEVGITIRFCSQVSHVPWSELKTAHYRRLAGQLELEFAPLNRLVVLTNVDLNWGRRTVLAARQYVEEKTAARLKKTIL
jgi:hypothetical protein